MEKLSTILCQLVCMLWQELQIGDKAGPRMAVKQGKPNSARTPECTLKGADGRHEHTRTPPLTMRNKPQTTEQQLRACVRACVHHTLDIRARRVQEFTRGRRARRRHPVPLSVQSCQHAVAGGSISFLVSPVLLARCPRCPS